MRGGLNSLLTHLYLSPICRGLFYKHPTKIGKNEYSTKTPSVSIMITSITERFVLFISTIIFNEFIATVMLTTTSISKENPILLNITQLLPLNTYLKQEIR